MNYVSSEDDKPDVTEESFIDKKLLNEDSGPNIGIWMDDVEQSFDQFEVKLKEYGYIL